MNMIRITEMVNNTLITSISKFFLIKNTMLLKF